MRLRKSTGALFVLIFFVSMAGLFMMMQAELDVTERAKLSAISPVETEVEQINKRVRKLEDEMHGNVEMMSSIKSKLELLMKLDGVGLPAPADPQIDHPPVAAQNSDNSKVLDFIEHPEESVKDGGHGECPAVVPYGLSNADHNMENFIEKWDFVDVDGGVWKQGWTIKTSDAEWKETKLKVILMPHSHNDPGWVKTLAVYYQGQTKIILNTIVDALHNHPKRKFIWAETIFLNMWMDDPTVTTERKNNFRSLLEKKQIEIVTGGWVMTEEAPTHYFAMMDQLIEGHQWLKKHFNYHPKNGYNCDTFGATPTTAYLNSLAGLDHMLIQRTHYVVKKHFAMDKLLEFNWRQSFDDRGSDDIFTHMMPFYSYDVPHTCGPEPSVCCQFDFRRLRGQSPAIACPWGIAPQEINSRNVQERARMILDQYRKKAKLYAKGTEENTHVVLTLLGDDFRYDSKREADAQFENYERLFEYINNTPELNAEVAFGTLADYFSLVNQARPIEQAPKITGDFYSYSDRVDNYWTGFFNSRPYYKWFDRYLQHWVQATDTAMSIALLNNKFANNEEAMRIYNIIKGATRTMDLFQHHDAITGTEKDFVVKDYADRLTKAANSIQVAYKEVMAIASGEPDLEIELLTEKLVQRGRIPRAKTIVIEGSSVLQCKVIDVYNSLLHSVEDVIRLKISGTPHLTAEYLTGGNILGQVSPWWDAETEDGRQEPNILHEDKFELHLAVSVDGLSTRRIKICGKDQAEENTKPLSTVELHSGAANSQLGKFNPIVSPGSEVEIHNEDVKLFINHKNGLLKSTLTNFDFDKNPNGLKSEMNFVKYGTRGRGNGQDHSGAYLFMPDGPAVQMFGQSSTSPFRVIRGPLVNEVHILHALVLQRLSLYSTGLSRDAINVENYVDVRGQSNVEFLMRIDTGVDNNKVLHTDLNGLSIAQKKYHDKLHIQGNVYPIVTAAYLEDKQHRFNIFTKQPSGVSSQSNGQIEIWLDRTLAQDDARGLGQPVVDNVLTKADFKILLETRKSDFKYEAPSIYLSPLANRLVEFMHSPLIPSLITRIVNQDSSFQGLRSKNIPYDAKLINLRPTMVNGGSSPSAALILRRYGSDCSFMSGDQIENNFAWPISPAAIFGEHKITETSLTLLDVKNENVREINLEPMKIKVFQIIA